MNGGETFAFARQIESSKLMIAQRQVAMSPLHIGTRALEYVREPLRLLMKLFLSLRAHLTQDAIRLKQGGAQLFGEFAKRLATLNGPSLSHTL